jgi:hypothetical protein
LLSVDQTTLLPGQCVFAAATVLNLSANGSLAEAA